MEITNEPANPRGAMIWASANTLKQWPSIWEVRPWIQDFSDYAFDGRTYTADEIRLQMEGTRQAGGRGWLLWDPRVKYTPEALVSAQPVYRANLDGEVLVLEYHLIGEPEDRWQRTPANFRADLERLWSEGSTAPSRRL